MGRDASPVLDRYPPRPESSPAGAPFPPPAVSWGAAAPRGPTPPSSGTATSAGEASRGGGSPPEGLIRLEKPFDVDEFSQLLGGTRIRVTVPHDALAEVLRRVTDFMGFGIYVYAITVRPAPSELLKGYVVELQRVDYDAEAKEWRPFVERGAAGPSPDSSPPGR